MKVESPITMKVQKGDTRRVVYVNQLQHRIQPPTHHANTRDTATESYMPWQPPQIEHIILPDIGEPSGPPRTDDPPTMDDPPGADIPPHQDEPPGAPTHRFPTRQQ